MYILNWLEIRCFSVPNTIHYFWCIVQLTMEEGLATRSKELLECYRGLSLKYPEACKTYNIDSIIKYAVPFLED